jgi:hypothetical protein
MTMIGRHLVIKSWLRQADEDLKAGQAIRGDVSECHRRYWLQQACEKGIKALGIILWKDNIDDEIFKHNFLHKHSPLKNLLEILEKNKLTKSLYMLVRQIEAEINKLEGKDIIRKVDATTPTTDLTDVSYRYPFVDKQGNIVAPVDYPDWNSYQGNAMGVTDTIKDFLTKVRNRLMKDRYPK